MRLIIGISGASGIIIAIELLKKLKHIDNIETHLIITKSATLTLQHETNFDIYDLKKISNVTYDIDDIGALSGN